jgi:hypothetical protein
VKKLLFAAALIAALTSIAVAQDAKTMTRAVTPQSANTKVKPASTPTAPSYCNPCLFYGGDWPYTSSSWVAFGNGNEYYEGTIYNYSVYNAVMLPSKSQWKVLGLFSNNIFYNYETGENSFKLDPNTVDWTINTGVSSGNGGTVVASGTSTGSIAPTGRSYEDVYFEYTVKAAIGEATGPVLKGGTEYWFVAAGNCTDSSCTEFMYQTDSNLANAYGPPQPACGSFQNGPEGGINFENLCDEGYTQAESEYTSAGVIGHGLAGATN